jgi:hypothetical protein
MPEPTSPLSNTPEELVANLHSTAKTLIATKRLTPTAQKALASLVDELGNTLASGKTSSEELVRLAECVAQLDLALHAPENREHPNQARERLKESIYQAEANHPYITGLAHQLLNILAELGI